MNGGFFFSYLFVKFSADETNCENLCGAKPCELVSLSSRDLAESRDRNTNRIELCSIILINYETSVNDGHCSVNFPFRKGKI